MTSPEERRALNESTFRDANEKIRAVRDELRPPLEQIPFVCECPDLDCRVLVALTVDEYERVRADGTHFLIAPGHERTSDVIHEHARFEVVSKDGVAGAVAQEHDPRTGG